MLDVNEAFGWKNPIKWAFHSKSCMKWKCVYFRSIYWCGVVKAISIWIFLNTYPQNGKSMSMNWILKPYCDEIKWKKFWYNESFNWRELLKYPHKLALIILNVSRAAYKMLTAFHHQLPQNQQFPFPIFTCPSLFEKRRKDIVLDGPTKHFLSQYLRHSV